MEEANSLICVVSLDQDNYQTLFGVLDNSFLVAYAIGMFIRFVCVCCWQMLLCLCLSVCVCAMLNHNAFSCSQWDLRRAPASAVLPEFWDGDEWIVHVSVWPRLLLEHPLTGVLRLHPGKDSTPQSDALSLLPEVKPLQTLEMLHRKANIAQNVTLFL